MHVEGRSSPSPPHDTPTITSPSRGVYSLVMLDHLLWEEFHLEEAQRRFADLTGITPEFGGAHPDRGTHNSLLSLGGGCYLEIIAPDSAQTEAFGFPKEVPPGFEPGLYTFGMRSDNLDHVRHLAERAGLSASSPQDVSREGPNGEVLRWQTLIVGGHDFGHALPFFTRFDGVLHPSETSPKGCELLEFSVGHPDNTKLSRLYDALDVNVPVFWSEQPRLRTVLATPKGEVTLNSHARFG